MPFLANSSQNSNRGNSSCRIFYQLPMLANTQRKSFYDQLSARRYRMAGVVHAGSQLRWYEELCRIKIEKLRDAAEDNGRSLRTGRLPRNGGVYCFWWTGSRDLLAECNRQIELHGPGGRPVILSLDDEQI